jgi:membrane protease YdiL (CAAX protease family)
MNIKSVVKDHPLASYVLINYTISWAFLYPCYQLLLAAKGSFPPLALFGLIGSCGPSIAALIILSLTEGKVGVTAALGKFTLWRAPLRWYLLVLFLPMAVYGVAVLLHIHPEVDLRGGLMALPVSLLIALPFGPLGEELGWRGFLLPLLLRRHGVVSSTLMVGTLWTVWHVASFTFPGAAIPSFFAITPWSVFLFFAFLITESFAFTYVYIKTKGSLIFAVLLHMAFNAGPNVIQALFPSLANATTARASIYVTEIFLVAAWTIGCFFLDPAARNAARYTDNKSHARGQTGL